MSSATNAVFSRSGPTLPFALLLILAGVTACHDAATVLGPEDAAAPAFAKNAAGTIVSSLDDPGDGDCTSNHCTLREAIAAAPAGGQISFKNNLTGMIALSAGQLVINKDLTIDGAGRIAVDAQGASRAFDIVLGTVTLTGFTITGGGTPAGDHLGGGIRNAGTLILANSTVSGNVAENGGGAYNIGVMTIVNSTVSENIATEGGGLYNDAGHSLMLERTTVSGNGATSGGGIFNGGDLSLTRTTVSDNRAFQGGGIINFNATRLALRSSTITRNIAGDDGGGLWSAGFGDYTAVNTILAGNEGGGLANGYDCFFGLGAIRTLGHNLTRNGAGCDFAGAEDTDVVLGFSVPVFTDVLEFALADNGGPTLTHALIERGFAVDAGRCPGENVDQRGFARPFDDPLVPNTFDGCDIGAFEWQPAPTGGPGKGPKK